MKIQAFIILCILLYIKCYFIQCNKEYTETPSSEFHCSGLNISIEGDTHCCLWEYKDEKDNPKARCSSISDYQFNNITAYIEKKRKNYTDLVITCAKEETLYCSNIMADQESISDCSKLKIPNSTGDKYCCRWKFKDTTNNKKKNNYCASISEYQYITIEEYIKYKTKTKKKYSDLSIDCSAQIINIVSIIYLFLLFIIISYIL